MKVGKKNTRLVDPGLFRDKMTLMQIYDETQYNETVLILGIYPPKNHYVVKLYNI